MSDCYSLMLLQRAEASEALMVRMAAARELHEHVSSKGFFSVLTERQQPAELSSV